SSVRGAIDMVLVADRLARLRDVPTSDPGVGLDAALAALTGRIRVHEGGERSAEEIITELW
ncbi:MAG TPA: ATPase, partial [Microbacterium sp.]|nr:ATPase [Microbacterium sp.]